MLPRPTPEELIAVARWTLPELKTVPAFYEGVARVLARQGRTLDGFDDNYDEFAEEQPALASCYGAALSDRQLLGASPGAQTRKLVHPVRELRSPDEALAEVGGVNASRAQAGSEVVPGPAPKEPEPVQLQLVLDGNQPQPALANGA